MTHFTPQEYVRTAAQKRRQIEELEREIRACENAAQDCPFPVRVRPARPSDIRVGAVIWYEEDDDGKPFWQVVLEVDHPDDDFKAYTAEDGCRYGLLGAWVETARRKRASVVKEAPDAT